MILLSNDEVEQALTPRDAIVATETIYRELAEGKAINRPRSQTYMPVESKQNPGFRYRFKSQEGSGVDSGVWALRITSDMAGFSYTAGVKRRRILPVATGNRYCGLVILFDLERIEPIAIMPDGVIQKVRVAALSVVGAKYLAPDKPKVLGLFGSGWQAGAHLEFLCAQFSFEKVKVYSPNHEHCREFCHKITTQLGREIQSVDSSHASCSPVFSDDPDRNFLPPQGCAACCFNSLPRRFSARACARRSAVFLRRQHSRPYRQ